MSLTRSAGVIAAMATVVLSAMPAVAEQGLTRRVVYPHDPAPTLLEDLAAVTGTPAVSAPASGGQGRVDDTLAGGLQTLRLNQTLRDAQRSVVSQVTGPSSVSSPPAFVCICITSQVVSTSTLTFITLPPVTTPSFSITTTPPR